MKIKKILSVILSLILLNSCTGFSDAIQGKKRSENSDEFLVQKKNPLTSSKKLCKKLVQKLR